MRKTTGQVILEYGILIIAVVAAMMIFVRFLGKAVEEKMNTFQDELVITHQKQGSP